MDAALGKITITRYLAEKEVGSHAYSYNCNVRTTNWNRWVSSQCKWNPTTVMSVSKEVVRKMCKVLIIFMFQESKWSFFKRKIKQNTNFENPIYAEVFLNIV